MKKLIIAAFSAVVPFTAIFAQSSDPIVMTVAGVDVPRSEFEYSYNKNNTDGFIDKKTVEEYVESAISSRRMLFSSDVLTYLSRATRSSMR